MSNHSRLYEDVFHTSSSKLCLRSTDVFGLDLQLDFNNPDILEVTKTDKGQPHVVLTLTEADMDEITNYWHSRKEEKNMAWNHRLCKRTIKTSHGTSTLYGVHEAYYNKAGELCAVTEEATTLDTEQWTDATEKDCINDLKEMLVRIERSLDAPMLDLDNISYAKYDGEDDHDLHNEEV